MDRFVAMMILLVVLVISLLIFLALFAVAPIVWSCVVTLLYTLYLYLSNESHEVHDAQEFENRFWTIFAVLFSTAVIFAHDSPLAFGLWSPSLGFIGVLACGYGMHIWDRYLHRQNLAKVVGLKRGTTTASSLNRLHHMGIEEKMNQINSCLKDIDQLLIPSTINNLINPRIILSKEREIISVFEEAGPKELNYLVTHAKLGLLFYKIKDHRSFNHHNRTQLIELLAVDRISQLTVLSKVIVLHSLLMMKLPANIKAEHWVRNIILSTKQDDLSDLKTFTDAKGDYFCMNKLIYEDIRSDMVRQDILKHIEKEARVQMAHMAFKTKRSKIRKQKAWRKVLSDVDDTLTCSGGSYPSGIDKRYGKKVVYPGVLGFYRELDLGTDGPEEWPPNTVGNLVFLSARPHLYRDLTEKVNFAKFEKLKLRSEDGRSAMHTTPSLLPGDITSGWEYIVKEDFEPLAVKKFENFQRYVSIYPEFRHVFVCDNGQGDVRASELMVEKFPKNVEAIYVHRVQSTSKTYYTPEKWKQHGIRPFFFDTYPEAALDAVQRNPPLIRVAGLRRICHDSINDFYMIQQKDWPSEDHKRDRRYELNQSLWRCNLYLESVNEKAVPLLEAEREWRNGELVQTPYGTGTILSFEPYNDLYEVELDWRPINVQIDEYKRNEKRRMEMESNASDTAVATKANNKATNNTSTALETVFESTEEIDDELRASSFNSSSVVESNDTSEVPELKEEPTEERDVNQRRVDTAITGTKAMDDSNHSISSRKNDENEAEHTPTYNDTETKEKANNPSHPVISKIQGRLISKFEPLSLPEENKNKSGFSFWGSRAESSRTLPKAPFNHGDKCNTIFGEGRVKEYRQESGIVVVEFISWTATGYLKQDDVDVGGEGFFRNLLRSRKTSQRSINNTTKEAPKEKELGFPYVKGAVIQTPYGEGKVCKPLPKPNAAVDPKAPPSEPASEHTKTLSTASIAYQTIGILLVAWMLADGSHPVLYCTPQTAFDWKKVAEEEEERSKTSGGILSAFMKLIKGPAEKESKSTSEIPTEIVVPQFERYYMDSASVTTPFGPGIVSSFRSLDGIYEVILSSWKMMGGAHPKVYLMKDQLSYLVASGCLQGFPVLTSLGLSGTLASVQPMTGIHIVTVQAAGMVLYLQPKDIICPLKAAMGEEVLTPYGEGKVLKYRLKDNIYEVDLASGAKLHANVEAIKRVNDGLEDERSFGMKWLLRRIFLLGDNESRDSQRSRSNSITSYRSQSTKSIM